MNSEVQERGFTIITGILEKAECEELLSTLGPISGAGRRGLLGTPAVALLANSTRLVKFVELHLQSEPRPVRAVYFDKSSTKNWLVSWHQDLTLALRDRHEVPGFGPWSVKEGIPHVQPPIELLEQMLTIRLHLDDADESNGALRVLPGSHRRGRLSAAQIREFRSQLSEVVCKASAGDALLMRPLLLHASGRSFTPRHRRILHIEYAAFTLPKELQWHEAA